MMRKVAAGAVLLVAALSLGSAAGATHTASDLPTITLDASESVAVSDDPVPAPPADASVGEPVTAADQVGLFPPADGSVFEAIRVGDDVLLVPPALVNVGEAVGVSDAAIAVPPVVVNVAEAVGVSDAAIALPPVVVNVNEGVGVSDAAIALPPTAVNEAEAVGVADAVEVTLNSPPVANAGGLYTVDEGGSVRLNGSGVDPEGGPLTFLWSPSAYLDDATSAQPSFSAPDNGTTTLTLTVKDSHGLTGSAQTTVTVKNVAPVLAAGGDAEIPAGSLLTRSVTFTDPGADSWRGSVDFGDGSAPQSVVLPSRSFPLSHLYANPGTFTVHVSVSDDDGGIGTASFAVHVLNTAPQVSAGPDATLNEGGTLTRTGTIVDTPDTWTGTVDYGDGGGPSPLAVSGSSFSLSHVYRDNGDYTVHVVVSDSHGATGTASFTAHVRNVAPSVGDIVGVPAGAVRLGSSVSLHAPFTDPGSLDTFTSTWRWGDGSTSPGVIAAHTTSASHVYAAPGVYSVTVSVTDDDGGSGQSAAVTVLVYNPRAGSVIGVGTIPGPGAFALAVRNEGGGTVGAAEFSSGRGGILFHADSFDWLLAAHGCALTTGHGKVDGKTGFSFWVTAVQGAGPDQFRIRIWKTASGAPVLDTGSGLLTDCSTPDRLSFGAIVVRSS
jgi:PKD repeat protein